MPWPTTVDYSEAIQNLRTSVGDDELRGGDLSKDRLGLPLRWTGNFAIVYRVHCSRTDAAWAVKCFTRNVPERQTRYRRIAEHLDRARLPFTVDFEYLDEGIRVRGDWYPVVKMRWVEGLRLNEFVEEHLGRPKMLRQLLDLWPRMARRLRESQMAHADLQHGNVLLVPLQRGQLALKLVDYDGMHVPAIAGTQSGEVGHPAYQHPARLRDGTYNAEVDRFSHLAIYTAVRALAAGHRDLWPRFNNGDNLLFRSSDLASPGDSELFQTLWHSRDLDVRALAGRLALAAQRPLEETPLLDEIIDGGRVRPLSSGEESAAAALLAARSAAVSVAPARIGPSRLPPGSAPATDPVAPAGTEPAAAGETLPAGVVGEAPILAELVDERGAWERTTAATADAFRLAFGGLRALDRGVMRLVGEENTLLHHFLRFVGVSAFAAAVVLLLVGFPGGNRPPTDRPTAATTAETMPGDDQGDEPESTPIAPLTPPPVVTPPGENEVAVYIGGGVRIEMVLIPAGEFMMGSPDSDTDAVNDEKPQHRVRITRPFYLGKYEVTQQQWQAVMGGNPSHFKDDSRNPVEMVSWNDCQEFLGRLNERTDGKGRELRLPTEAEWEHACRAGTTTRYSFGDDEGQLGDYVWFGGNSGNRTQPVGRKKPNAWGLCDMQGNVREWCADWYAGDYYAISPAEDPRGPDSGTSRVVRGGAWPGLYPFLFRSAYRTLRATPEKRYPNFGFRVAMTLPPGDITPSPPSAGQRSEPAPLRLQTIARQQVEAGSTLNVTVLPEEPETWNGQLRFVLAAGAPAGATIDSQTGEFTWTPAADHRPGTHQVVVLAQGPQGQQAQTRFTVEVRRPMPEREIVEDLGGGTTLEMVLIPAGEFMMGSPDSDRDAQDHEKPQHRVRITRPFYLGKYEVTQEQWQAVMGGNPSYFKGPANPVERVSWNDCQEFLRRLNERSGGTGREFRLPTEAEWEYACRAGTTTRYSFGDDAGPLGEYAWFGGNSGNRSQPVGQKKPNAWGLYDMQGNVSESCADWYARDYYARSPAEDPPGPDSRSDRVLRGGPWLGGRPDNFRCAFRDHGDPDYGNEFCGFRVARTLTPGAITPALPGGGQRSEPAPTPPRQVPLGSRQRPLGSAPYRGASAFFPTFAPTALGELGILGLATAGVLGAMLRVARRE